MASLADATPPIALGALDGRYRGAVAPLVDHLSEAALNRERVRVEVEWLIHLTTQQRRARASAPLTDDETAAAARRRRRTSAPTRSPSSPRSSGVTVARRQGRRVLPQEAPRRDRPGDEDRGPRRADPLLLHQRGHQQPLLRPHGQGRGRRRSGCRAAQRARRPGRRRWRATCATCRCSPTPTASRRRRRRWARSSPSSRTGCGRQLRRIERRGVPRQAQRRHRHLRRARRRRARRRLAAPCREPSSRASGLHLEPADHPDREPRLAGRALRRRRAVQPDPAQPLHRRLDLHLDRLLRAGAAARAPSGRSTMPHKVNPIRFENAEANLEVCNALLDVLGATLVTEPAAARPHRLLHAAQHRRGVRPLAAGHRQRRRGLAGLDAVPERDGRRPRRQLGGARRADPVGDARRSARRASRAWRTPTSGSRS